MHKLHSIEARKWGITSTPVSSKLKTLSSYCQYDTVSLRIEFYINSKSVHKKLVHAVSTGTNTSTRSIRAFYKKKKINNPRFQVVHGVNGFLSLKLPVFDLTSLLQLCLLSHSTSSTCGRLGSSSSASRWSCWYFLLKKPNCEEDTIRNIVSVTQKKTPNRTYGGKAATLTFHSSPTTRASSSRPPMTLPTITPTGTSAFSPGLLTVSGTCTGGAISRFVPHSYRSIE